MSTTDSETVAALARERLAILTDDPGAQFRPGQLDAIRDVVVDRARVLCVQRTGWGKWACSSSPPRCSAGTAPGRR